MTVCIQHMTERLRLNATEIAEAIEDYVRSRNLVHGVKRIEFTGYRLDEGALLHVDGCTVVTYTNVETRL